ncbi:putative ribonuclease H-like domain-containing protein [Tanacetum coccineum]
MPVLEDDSIFDFTSDDDDDGATRHDINNLVLQSATNQRDVDYDEVFALVARIEAIRLFLAYASFLDLWFINMDVKCDFDSTGKIKEEVIRLISDYVGEAWMESTMEVVKFLRCRLLYWQCKKQTVRCKFNNRSSILLLIQVAMEVLGFRINYLIMDNSYEYQDLSWTITIAMKPELIQMVKRHTDKNVADLCFQKLLLLLLSILLMLLTVVILILLEAHEMFYIVETGECLLDGIELMLNELGDSLGVLPTIDSSLEVELTVLYKVHHVLAIPHHSQVLSMAEIDSIESALKEIEGGIFALECSTSKTSTLGLVSTKETQVQVQEMKDFGIIELL